MSIESLKQKARKAEQKEDWQKALELYNKALAELARDDQVDIGLYNRVGDLYVRVGKVDRAVENYEMAVELYREAYLPNNAIAVCKKIIRHVPRHNAAYLVIGQIRAEQGFLPDARTNFLTYAERMQAAGELDESFRALVEFCDLAPDDVGVRVTVADQMAAQGREDEAVEQLLIVHRRHLERNQSAEAAAVEEKIRAIDPEADLTAMRTAGFGDLGGEEYSGFGEIQIGTDAFAGGDSESEAELAIGGAMEEASGDHEQEEDAEVEADVGGFEIKSGAEEGEQAPELPTMDFDDEEPEEEAPELPMMDFGNGDEDEAPELPTMDFGDDREDDETAEPSVGFQDDDAGALPTTGIEPTEALEESTPEPPAVTPAEPTPGPPASAEEPTGSGSPPQHRGGDAGDDSFVDLGAMILGREPKKEKSTRFTVAYQEPSGDEEADFAKMLNQFKDKVTENLDTSDVRAHYDLGTAYKEMGLLEEAITSFQAALRASSNHLPTYEMMGQTFIEMGQPDAAVRSLERALDTASSVEDELVGIYYYLGRAYEELEKKDSAVDYYDRVFALDINFADVTERLRDLR